MGKRKSTAYCASIDKEEQMYWFLKESPQSHIIRWRDFPNPNICIAGLKGKPWWWLYISRREIQIKINKQPAMIINQSYQRAYPKAQPWEIIRVTLKDGFGLRTIPNDAFKIQVYPLQRHCRGWSWLFVTTLPGKNFDKKFKSGGPYPCIRIYWCLISCHWVWRVFSRGVLMWPAKIYISNICLDIYLTIRPYISQYISQMNISIDVSNIFISLVTFLYFHIIYITVTGLGDRPALASWHDKPKGNQNWRTLRRPQWLPLQVVLIRIVGKLVIISQW